MPDSLSAALATLRSRYGPLALRRGDQQEAAEMWPTDVPVLDGVLTPGGLPRGRITVLTAASGRGPSGRLTLLQSLTAMASRSGEVGYIDIAGTLDPGFLADLSARLEACLVVTPDVDQWGRGFAMARALAIAGMPWLGIALGAGLSPRPALWEHALIALVEAVSKRGAVCVIAAPGPPAAPLAHAASLTLSCAAAGWQRGHGDVTGIRVLVTTTKCKVGLPSGADHPTKSAISWGPRGTATLLLRYPRPYAEADVVGLPSVLTPQLHGESMSPAAGGVQLFSAI